MFARFDKWMIRENRASNRMGSILFNVAFGRTFVNRSARRSSLWLLVAPLLLPLFASHAEADELVARSQGAGTPEVKIEPDVAKLLEAGHSVKWNYTPPGKADRYGHAEVLVRAPIAKVRQQVMNYSQYKEFDPKRFTKSHIVAKEAGNTDVYMELPMVGGMIILSQTVRFFPLQHPAQGVEAVEGRFINGKNIKDANVIMTMKEVTPQVTLLKCDLLVAPSFIAPQWAIDEELRDAAMKAVDYIHDHAQGSSTQVVALNPIAMR